MLFFTLYLFKVTELPKNTVYLGEVWREKQSDPDWSEIGPAVAGRVEWKTTKRRRPMALLNCPECKKQVSEHALTCPNCGYTFKRGEATNLKSQQTKNKRIAWLLVIVFFFWLIGKCSSDSNHEPSGDVDKLRPEAGIPEASTAPSRKQGVVFNSATDFRQAFNTQSKNLGFDYKIEKFKVSAGDVQNTFTVKLKHELMLLGVVSKQNSGVKEIMVMMGAGASAVDFLSIIAVLIASADPALTADERGEILDEIGIFNATPEALTDFEKSIQRNGIKYGFMANDVIGVSFWVAKGD